MAFERLNGTSFEQLVRGGYRNLCNREQEIDSMNVFPVPDGDTGYNMRRTLENGIATAHPNKHMGRYLAELSRGMLLGARGNSGVILSQLFRGLAEELKDNGIVNAGELRDALVRSYRTAYSAIVNPVEGTMLTVAREGIENIRSRIVHGTTCRDVLIMYLDEMRVSVRRTPDLLSVLREAGVLDSGAIGLITIYDGMVRTLNGETIPLTVEHFDESTFAPSVDVDVDADTPFAFGYCMEFLLQLSNIKRDVTLFDEKEFISNLTKWGESLVVVRTDNVIKVHIHTFTPETVMAYAHKFGEFIAFKLDNMQLQHKEYLVKKNVETETKDVAATEAKNVEVETKELKPLAVVSVADGVGISDILKGCGCDVVLEGGPMMNTSAEDFVRAYRSLAAERIVVLPNNENIAPAALQAARICGIEERVTIIETNSVMEGYYALALGSQDMESPDERIACMKDGAESIVTVSVARAVRDYASGEFSCKKGDYIGFIGKKLVSADPDLVRAAVSAIAKVPDIQDMGFFVIFKGARLTDENEQQLDAALEEHFSDLDREFLEGGQSAYVLIVGIV